MSALELHQLPEAFQNLIARVEEERPLSPAKAKRLLSEAEITTDDLEPWTDYDHPAGDSYGRKLVYDGGHFELMVMSWRDGDYSAIHDHGYTQWGAVKLFGPAEHAVFSLKNGRLETMDRSTQAPGTVLAVAHDLIHQMGNVGQPPYLTLHLYGCYERDGGVTDDARIFALDEGAIQYTSGGVFFNLPEESIDDRKEGLEADFSTRLRHDVELARRLRATIAAGVNGGSDRDELASRERRVVEDLYSAASWHGLQEAVAGHLDAEGRVETSPRWKILFRELRAAADFQQTLLGDDERARREAELWDQVIAPRHLERYVAEYLRFTRERYRIDFPHAAILSIGCRTGLVEAYLQRELGAAADHFLGLEPSEQMLRIAAGRLRTEAADLRRLASEGARSSLVLAGIHALQRPGAASLEETIEAIAGLTRPGGHFVGDFVLPPSAETIPEASVVRGESSLFLEQSRQSDELDPARWLVNDYLDAAFEADRLSLRSSRERLDARASPASLYPLFLKHFHGNVHLYDALTLEPVAGAAAQPAGARYLLVAEKPAA